MLQFCNNIILSYFLIKLYSKILLNFWNTFSRIFSKKFRKTAQIVYGPSGIFNILASPLLGSESTRVESSLFLCTYLCFARMPNTSPDCFRLLEINFLISIILRMAFCLMHLDQNDIRYIEREHWIGLD